MVDIFRRVSERRRWNADEYTLAEIEAEKNREKQVWNGIMKQMYTPFQILAEAIDQGLEHAGICLEILLKSKISRRSRSSGSDDVEAHGDAVSPGNQCFGSLVDKKVRQFYSQEITHSQHLIPGDAQFYATLYMQQLMYAAREALQDPV
jgi:hypothetical protein